MDTPLVLTDADVDRLADLRAAIYQVDAFLRTRATATQVAPFRHRVAFQRTTELVFAVGGSTGKPGIGGFRAYFSRSGQHFDDQVVAVWDLESGDLKGVVIGSALGVLRMGAIGGVAINALADPEADTLGVLGTGRQAKIHILAAAAVRPLKHVRVFGRDPSRSQAFAADLSRRLGIEVYAAPSAALAVAEAAIVVGATNSLRPAVSARDLRADAYVHSVGYKSPVAKEFGLDVPERADLLVTDSPEQVAAFGETFILSGTPYLSQLRDLADFISGERPVRPSRGGFTVCYPVGLSGTDVVVADDLLSRAG
jgi:ornithine cyclodeaminase